jgi:GTP:adenosylcobinamide-phosphate guanylyltransferase
VSPRFSALVLAGRRGAGQDPVLGGAAHRALFPVAGVPMLARVVGTLRRAPCVGRVLVSIDDPAALDATPGLDGVECLRSLDSPSRSVSDALARLAPDGPVLVTTADHALLTPEMIEHFAGEAAKTDADLLVAAVAASVFRARYPHAARTVLPLRGEGYTGANLFAFLTPDARRAADFWVRAERFRKRPWRLFSVLGPGSLLLLMLRRLDLEAALARVSAAMGCRVRVACLPFPEAAIDVDSPGDAALAERILAEREL